MESTDDKFKQISSEATRDLMKMPPLQIAIDSVDAFLVVQNLQLALTHPNNQGEGAKFVEDIARKLQTVLGQRSRKAFEALELGWHNKSDRNNHNKCKACGAPIIWEQTKSGKFTPKNLDGTSHWATCPEARKFKKGKTTNAKNNASNVAGSSNRP